MNITRYAIAYGNQLNRLSFLRHNISHKTRSDSQLDKLGKTPISPTIPRTNSHTIQNLALPNPSVNSAQIKNISDFKTRDHVSQTYQYDLEKREITYQVNDKRSDYFSARGQYFSLIMPDIDATDPASLIIANTQGLGAGGKLLPVKNSPLRMKIFQPLSACKDHGTPGAQCTLHAPDGFKLVFSPSADLATVSTLMQVRSILESGTSPGGSLPTICLKTPNSVTVSTKFQAISKQKMHDLTFSLVVAPPASIHLRHTNDTCDIVFQPNNKTGNIELQLSLTTTEPCPQAVALEDIFRPEYLKSIVNKEPAQQALLSFALLTPENQTENPTLNGSRAGGPRFLSPFGRDGIISTMSFLPIMQPKAAVNICILPHLARILSQPHPNFPTGTACHEVIKEIIDDQEVLKPSYSMVDTAPLLTTLIGQVLANPEYKSHFMNCLDHPILDNSTTTNRAKPITYRQQLEALLCHIVSLTKPFAETPENPLSLPRFAEGYNVGDWADSHLGNFNTRITLANAAIFNNALATVSKLLDSDINTPSLRCALANTLECTENDVSRELKNLADRYRSNYLNAFITPLCAEEAQEMVRSTCRALNISPDPALSEIDGNKEIEIIGLGITEESKCRAIPNLNVAYALQDPYLSPTLLHKIVEQARRPFPLGLHMPGAGLTVAASLQPHGQVPNAAKDDYHINTIWPFMSFLFIRGLIQHYHRPELNPQLRQKISALIEKMTNELEANRLYYCSELFSAQANTNKKSFIAQPFEGSVDGKGRRIGCPIQLWSALYAVTLDAAKDFLRSRTGEKVS